MITANPHFFISTGYYNYLQNHAFSNPSNPNYVSYSELIDFYKIISEDSKGLIIYFEIYLLAY